MKGIIFFVFILTSALASGQVSNDMRNKYDQQFIYRYGQSFMKGSDKVTFGMLQQEFKAPSLSADLYKKAKSNKTISRVFRFASTFAIFGVAKGLRDNNRTLAYSFLGGQIVTSFISLTLNNRSVTQTDRALQIHNRELLFPGR